MIPLISVIIPTFNRAGLLPRAISSVLSQTHERVELIIVDDGSTDDTARVVSEIGGCRYIYQTNQGQGSARNTGLEAANGEYIASLDSDDIWHSDFLEKSLNALLLTSASFSVASYRKPDSESYLEARHFLDGIDAEDSEGWKHISNGPARQLYARCSPSTNSSTLMIRSAMRDKWDRNMRLADDWDMHYSILLNGSNSCVFTLDTLWTKGLQDDNLSEGPGTKGKLAQAEVTDFSAFLSKNINRLTAAEIGKIRARIASSLLDVATSQAMNGARIDCYRTLTSALKYSHQSVKPRRMLGIIRESFRAKLNHTDQSILQ